MQVSMARPVRQRRPYEFLMRYMEMCVPRKWNTAVARAGRERKKWSTKCIAAWDGTWDEAIKCRTRRRRLQTGALLT